MRLTPKIYQKEKSGNETCVRVNVGFYKWIGIKKELDANSGAPARMRIMVAAEKGLFGTGYILYIDDGRRNIDCWLPPFNSMVENWERYFGSIEFISEKATKVLREGSKIFPKIDKLSANYLANDLASNLLDVAEWIDDDTVKSVKVGPVIYARDD